MNLFTRKNLLMLFSSGLFSATSLAQTEAPVSQDTLCYRQARLYEAQLNQTPKPGDPTSSYLVPMPDAQGRPFKRSITSHWARLEPQGNDTLAEYRAPAHFQNSDGIIQEVLAQQFYGPHTNNGPVKTVLTADHMPMPWRLMREFAGNETIYNYVRLNGPPDQNNDIRLIVGKNYCLIAD